MEGVKSIITNPGHFELVDKIRPRVFDQSVSKLPIRRKIGGRNSLKQEQ
jgi:hypothetical protein